MAAPRARRDGRPAAGGGCAEREVVMRVWQAHEKSVTALAFAPGGGTLATAGDHDPAARVWDVAAAKEVRTFSLFRETPACLAFTPDGRTLAAGWPWSIQLWD